MKWLPHLTLTGHNAPVYACVCDETLIYSAAGDRYVTRWKEDGTQDQFAVKLDTAAYVLALNSANMLVMGCANGTAVAIDTQSKKLLWEHNYVGSALFSCVDIPESALLVWGDASGNLILTDYDGHLQARFPLDCGKIRQLKRYGNFLFAACQDGTWKQFELPSFNELISVKAHAGGTATLTFFPSSNLLITGGKDAHLRVWDLVTASELKSLPAHYQTIYGLEQLSGTHQLVSVSMDKTIKIWNADSLQVEQRIEFRDGGHNRSVNGCIVQGEDRFITYGDDKKIVVWKAGL